MTPTGKAFEWEDIPLYIALVSSIMLNAPQLWRTFNTRHVKAFSVYTIVLRITANTAWLVYAVMIRNALLGMPSAINVIAEGALWVMLLRFRSQNL
jgi:uncharacterized protein with PQ loop repeat